MKERKAKFAAFLHGVPQRCSAGVHARMKIEARPSLRHRRRSPTRAAPVGIFRVYLSRVRQAHEERAPLGSTRFSDMPSARQYLPLPAASRGKVAAALIPI